MQKLPFSENYLPWHLPGVGAHLHIAADEAPMAPLAALMTHFRPAYRVMVFDACDC